jgi:Zn-dependent M16 (insulinase) family peptidase
VIGSWIHGGDPVSQLQLEPLLERFDRDLDDPEFVPGVIRKYFLDNPHRLTLTVVPDTEFSAKLEVKEEARLAAKLAGLTDADRAEIAATGLELKKKQDAVESGDALPTLAVSDIDREATRDAVRARSVERRAQDGELLTPVSVTVSEQPTNGIIYFRGLIDVKGLPDDLQEYMPVFCSVLTQLGAGDRDYRELAQTIKHHTGGLGCKVGTP